MENSELCYKANYSFTFTIPKNKTVYHRGSRQIFSQMCQEQQYKFMERQMHKVKKSSMKTYWVYEEHEDGRLHIHGFILDEYYEIIEEFRRNFYRFPIQISPKVYFRLSDIQETKFDIHYFIDYMLKNQHKIKYKMSSLQEFEDLNKLDGKNTNFKIFIETNESQRVKAETKDPPKPAGYLFGKKKNQFIINF